MNENTDINTHENYPNSNEHLEVPTMKVIPLKKICMTIGELPTSYLETMTYYETLLWFISYLRDNIIPTVNGNGEAVEELQSVVMSLQNYINEFKDSIDEDVENIEEYINNYFENLDVQEEINNKLDDMLEDGVLEQIIEQFVQSTALWCFNTLNDMQSSTNLINGSFTKTLGYYSINDGGGANYKIRTKNQNEVSDGSFLVDVNDSTLIAELIVTDEIYTKQVGAIGDGSTNDYSYISKIINYIKNNRKDGFTINVNGLHYIEDGILIDGTQSEPIKNLTIKGLTGNRNYANIESLKYGFIFKAKNEDAGFESNFGFKLNYCVSPKFEYLTIQTDENVSNGEIPLNNLIGIYINGNVSGINILKCKISNFYTGIAVLNAGLSLIENNNISYCNVGIRLAESGDNTLRDNYINTCGWNTMNLDGTIKEAYSHLNSIHKFFGIGIYLGSSSNNTIIGGKIEWNLKGIWQDYSNSNIITNIEFDRCSVYAISLTGHYSFIDSTNIQNNVFKSCGGITISGNAESGCCISTRQGNNVLINNNVFYGSGGSRLAYYKQDGKYYGPSTAGIRISRLNSGVISNNVFDMDVTPSTVEYSQICYVNNTHSQTVYISGNAVLYRQQPNVREYFRNDSNFTYGNFDAGDVIHKINNPISGFRCTTAGTVQTINTTVTVMNTENDNYPSDGSVLKLNVASFPAGLTIGSYVSIDGVTGTKKIIGIRYAFGDGWYIKLNSACDVAVINATMQNVSPVWSEFTG